MKAVVLAGGKRHPSSALYHHSSQAAHADRRYAHPGGFIAPNEASRDKPCGADGRAPGFATACVFWEW